MGFFTNEPYTPTFEFNNKILSYNRIAIAFNNISERAIEVPIGLDFLQQYREKRILEIGNVLRQYEQNETIKRDILDKFEIHPDVMNIDLMDYNPEKKYDAILSISTVEHIGQSANPQNTYGESKERKDREAPLKAICKIYHLLNKGGKGLITVPYGQLMDLDWLIQFSDEYLNVLTHIYGFPHNTLTTSYYKKIDMELATENPWQIWRQCEKEELKNTHFNTPFAFANGLAIIEIKKREDADFAALTPSTSHPLKYDSPAMISNLYFTPFTFNYGFDADGWIPCIEPGFIFYGPYLQIPQGIYRLKMKIETRGINEYRIDITSNQGEKVIWHRIFTDSMEFEEVLSFSNVEENVEIRLFSYSNQFESSIRIPLLLFFEEK